jgi:hypothetical protein
LKDLILGRVKNPNLRLISSIMVPAHVRSGGVDNMRDIDEGKWWFSSLLVLQPLSPLPLLD